MSTVIYGFKADKLNASEIVELGKSIRKQLEPIAQDEFCKSAVRLFEEALVYKRFGVCIDTPLFEYEKLEKANSNNYYSILNASFDIIDSIIRNNISAKTSMDYNGDFDIDVKLYLFPQLRGKTLIIPHVNNDKLMSALKSRDDLKDYSYWDDTNPPSDVGKSEWQTRKKNWNRVIPASNRLADESIVLDIFDTRTKSFEFLNLLRWSKYFVKYLRPVDELMYAAAYEIARENAFKTIREGNPSMSDIQVYHKSRDFLHQHPEVIQEIKSELNPIDIKSMEE